MPSLAFVQFFRHIRPRHDEDHLSPVLHDLGMIGHRVSSSTTKKKGCFFPWWCLIVAYSISLLFVGASVFLIIARSIEFGDLKTQKWLTSLVTGFFSSILLSQPIKVVCLTIFFACFTRTSSNADDEDDSIFPNGGIEDRLHPTTTKINRLSPSEAEYARVIRLREIRMWKLVRDVLYQLFFIWILFTTNYLNRNDQSSLQVQHLRRFLLCGERGAKTFDQVREKDDWREDRPSVFLDGVDRGLLAMARREFCAEDPSPAVVQWRGTEEPQWISR